MSIFHKPTRHQVIVTSCVLAWIFLVNVAAVTLGITAWALYFVTIFFFALGADKKNIPSIFVGGSLGLLAALGLHAGTFGLAPSLGALGAFSLSIGVVLAVIILGGTVCPLTVATVNFESVSLASTGYNLLVLWLGGAVILGGSVVAAGIGEKLAARRAAVPEETPEL